MIAYLALGVLLLLAIVTIARWFAEAEPGALVRAVKWVAGALAVALAIFLALTGRLVGALTDLTALAFLFVRWRSLWPHIKGFGGPAAGNASTVQTARLRMTLEHDSQSLDGEVLAGRFKGRALSELDLAQLQTLLDECRGDDAQGATLLETYLDRRFGPDWRSAGSGAGAGGSGKSAFSSGAMTREEAYEILGLEAGAKEDEIQAAYHRLMKKLHPDQGGSTFLAAKINRAREILLGQ